MLKNIILDFGSQTTQLIGRRVENSEHIVKLSLTISSFADEKVKGVILSGSPWSVNGDQVFMVDLQQIRGRYPVLGIGYGAHRVVVASGGEVESSGMRECRSEQLRVEVHSDPLLGNIARNSRVRMLHGDTITRLPNTFKSIASVQGVKQLHFALRAKIHGAAVSSRGVSYRGG